MNAVRFELINQTTKLKMKKSILAALFVFSVYTIQGQRNVDITNFRGGVIGGPIVGDFSDAYSFGLGVEMSHHWGVSKMLDLGVTTGFFNAFGSKETELTGGVVLETEFSNQQYIPLGGSLRIYPGKNVGFKFGSDFGYALGINEGNKGAVYYRPSIGLDLRNGSNEVNISYLVISDDLSFSSVLLGYLFLF